MSFISPQSARLGGVPSCGEARDPAAIIVAATCVRHNGHRGRSSALLVATALAKTSFAHVTTAAGVTITLLEINFGSATPRLSGGPQRRPDAADCAHPAAFARRPVMRPQVGTGLAPIPRR
jgi:hypothetical protein